MRRSSLWALMLCALLALSLGVAACGGDDDEGGGEQGAKQEAPTKGKMGGKLTALWTDDVDFIDPGRTYYQMGHELNEATQKTLMAYKPEDSETPVPDLAESDPEVSDDGKVVTFKLKQGVKFSPPVNREVTSADVKYAIERGFFNTVNNGYAGAYFGDLIGAKVGVDPGTEIEGLETPDKYTVVFRLERGTGTGVVGATTMGLSAPVPKEYADKFDKKKPESTYGQNQVATGPYMIENNAEGKAVGYEAGKRIHLVRNPNWDRSKDFRPAYLDEIDMPQGNDDTSVASRKILDGQSLISGDWSPPGDILSRVVRRQKDQMINVPTGGSRWVALNTTVPPFDDINIRKAVLAGFDREAMVLSRGGKIVGEVPTHFIPPGIAGYDQAGGDKGFGIDYMSHPKGDPALAGEYFKKAGMQSGKYEGSDEILMVGTNEGVAQKAAEVAKDNFEKLGFKVRLRLVTQDAMYTKYCNVPKQKVQACPNVGWLKDFSDAQTLLDPTFNGKNILPQNNSNWSQLDVPELNDAMEKAKTTVDPEERAQAWADVDRMITEQAPAVNWINDNQPLLFSKNVVAVENKFNAHWALAHISLK
jgi:peptide/nickel transport system substrate-binding protein